MKKLIIFCSLLAISLAAQTQEITPISKGSNEVKIIQSTKVLLYSPESKKRILIDENILINLLSKSKCICAKIDTVEKGKFIKIVEVSFPTNLSKLTGAYFESNFFEDNKEILLVKYTEFDKEDSYMVIFNNTNIKLINLLSKMLKAAPLLCKEDHTD